MIVGKKDYGLVNFKHSGDDTVYTHAQNLDGVLQEVSDRRKETHGGWSDNRSMRYVGSIPFIELERNPDLKAAVVSGDTKVIEQAVKVFFATQEGSRYLVNKLDTGKSGQVIVK